MKKLISKLLSTALVAMMAVNTWAYTWNSSVVQSQTTFSYAANGVIQQAVTRDGNGVMTQTAYYNSIGLIQCTVGADGKTVTAFYHYDAAGNRTSVDFTGQGSDGATHVYTQYNLPGGTTVTVDHGTGTKIDGQTGDLGTGHNNYTLAQITAAYNTLMSAAGAGKTWHDLGIEVASVSMSGAQISSLTDAQKQSVLGLAGVQRGNADPASSGLTLGQTCSDGGHVVGFVSINGITYGLDDSGQLVRNDGQTMGHILNNDDSFGTWNKNADGSITINYTNYEDSAWNGTVTIAKDGTTSNATKTSGNANGPAGAVNGWGLSAVLVGGLIYGADATGHLFNDKHVTAGTYDAAHNTYSIGADPTEISAAAAGSPTSTFTFTFDGSGHCASLSYFDQESQSQLSVSVRAISSNHSAPCADPLVTGKITGIRTVVDKNGVTHYYEVIAADKVDMFDGKGAQNADGEEILVEIDANMAAQMSGNIGQEVTVSGNVSASVDGHLTMTINEGGQVTGAAGTTHNTWMGQNQSFYNSMVNAMIKTYSGLGVSNSSWRAKWDALQNNTGPSF